MSDRAGPGRLVCLEGIDGAGKTTAATALTALLCGQGVPATVIDRGYRFPSSYVDGHLAGLRRLIWEHPPGDPYLQLGDLHWVHLQAAWYLAVQRCAVAPLLAAGRVVVVDTWANKFLAKLALRPGVDLDRVRSSFRDLRAPDLVVRIHIDPQVAAARKPVITASEAGNHDGVVRGRSQFIDYQHRLAAVLDAMGERAGWQVLDGTALTVALTAAALAAVLRDRFPQLWPSNTPVRRCPGGPT